MLSDPSEDTVDSAEKFEVASQEKGMRKDDMPDDIEEDVNSGFQPSSEGIMVKETSRRASSRTSSKEQSREKATEEGPSRKSKRKTATGKEKESEEGHGKKKKKRSKAAQAAEADLKKGADTGHTEIEEVHYQKADMGRVDLTAEGEEPPPPRVHPFMPQPRIKGGHITIKETDQGLGHLLIAIVLMNSIILPGDVSEYSKHSEHALMNRLTEVTYKANVIRTTTAQKQDNYNNHLKTPEEAGRHALQILEKQLK